MGYSYDYLPDVATADAAFAARADTLEELFIATALATAEVMVNLAGIRSVVKRKLSVRAENREDLLYRWLSQGIFQ